MFHFIYTPLDAALLGGGILSSASRVAPQSKLTGSNRIAAHRDLFSDDPAGAPHGDGL